MTSPFVPNVYNSHDKKTDMRNMPLNTLCIYPMNFGDFCDLLQGKTITPVSKPSVIQGQPNAFGIPTGHNGGFKSLTDLLKMYDERETTVKAVIDLAFHGLKQKIMNGEFNEVRWPAFQGQNGKYEWAQSILDVGSEVIDYITRMIDRLSLDQEVIDKLKPPNIDDLIVHDLTKMYNFSK